MGHVIQQNRLILQPSAQALNVASVVRKAAEAIVAKACDEPIRPQASHAESITQPVARQDMWREPKPLVSEIETATAPLVHETQKFYFRAQWQRLRRLWTDTLKEPANRIGRILTYAFAAWFAVVATLIVLYRFIDPPASNLMLYHYLTGRNVQHDWTPLKNISPAVIKAVVVSEDARFCRHWGIDFDAIQHAIRTARGRTPRGASTITMQTAKNMFLWQSKSYVRKILEVPVTILIELFWGKQRILEVYLNVAEWGPGIFGIGAAAKHHFKMTPARLGPAAASQLAAALPNPKVRRAGRPGPKTRRKANVIKGRARHANPYIGCVLR